MTTSKSGDSGSTDRFLKQHTERGLKRGRHSGGQGQGDRKIKTVGYTHLCPCNNLQQRM